MPRLWIRSNKLLVAAVRLGTRLRIFLDRHVRLCKALRHRRHLERIEQDLAQDEAPSPIEMRGLDRSLEVDRITRRGGEHAVLHQAHHLGLLVEGDRNERRAVALGRGVDTNLNRQPVQRGRQRRQHAGIPSRHIDELRLSRHELVADHARVSIRPQAAAHFSEPCLDPATARSARCATRTACRRPRAARGQPRAAPCRACAVPQAARSRPRSPHTTPSGGN